MLPSARVSVDGIISFSKNVEKAEFDNSGFMNRLNLIGSNFGEVYLPKQACRVNPDCHARGQQGKGNIGNTHGKVSL